MTLEHLLSCAPLQVKDAGDRAVAGRQAHPQAEGLRARTAAALLLRVPAAVACDVGRLAPLACQAGASRVWGGLHSGLCSHVPQSSCAALVGCSQSVNLFSSC